MKTLSFTTVYGEELKFHQKLGKTFVPRDNTTLNDKFNVDTEHKTGTHKSLYLGIGIGGNNPVLVGGISMETYEGQVGSLRNMIPWVVKPLTTDLDSDEQLKYKLRVEKDISGVRHACYYLKVIPETSVSVSIDTLTRASSGSTEYKRSDFDTNDSSILNPGTVPVETLDEKMEKLLTVRCTYNIVISKSEIEEIQNSYKLLISSTDTCIINELGLFSGVEDTITKKLHDIILDVIYSGDIHVGTLAQSQAGYQTFLELASNKLNTL